MSPLERFIVEGFHVKPIDLILSGLSGTAALFCVSFAVASLITHNFNFCLLMTFLTLLNGFLGVQRLQCVRDGLREVAKNKDDKTET